jgi:SNF2 family DNA or RNA helicase
MRIPYVIDNQEHVLADVLNALLDEHEGKSLDVATAFFSIRGFDILKDGLDGLGSFRLLLGAEPSQAAQIGLRPDAARTLASIREELNREPYTAETLRLIEALIRFLRKDEVALRVYEKGFLHAKSYIFYSDWPDPEHTLFDRFRPVTAIVGSSNFTLPGLTSNRELNLAHSVLLDPSAALDAEAEQAVRWLSEESVSDRATEKERQIIKSEVGARAIIDLDRWFERQWAEARDFKEDFIALLNESKFGDKEYTPFEIYMKALYEYFKDDLGAAPPDIGRSAIELAEFQEDAVKKARSILARYDGVMIADSVGLGKTWIAKKLLEDFAYHMREQALVICPASLREMWTEELKSATISAHIVSQEELGQADFEVERYGDADIVLVEESHNFRNRNIQRYMNLERLIGLNGGRGRAGGRKKVILVTATPINNDLMDLHSQVNLITQGDRGYFVAAGIGDLQRYFLNARQASRDGDGSVALFNLLEEVVVRRTRQFIRERYPKAQIRGETITFPERRLKTERYDLEATYQGIYEEVVQAVESLNLAPYNLTSYLKPGVEVDEFEAGRQQALVGIFKSRYLKRFESSVEAFRISIRRALEYQKTFESYLLQGKILNSSDFQRALRFLEVEQEEDDATPASRAEELDASEQAKADLDGLPALDPEKYNLDKLRAAVQSDLDALTGIWNRIKDITPKEDAKVARLKKLLAGPLRGKKVLVFSYYKDTARYLYRQLTAEGAADFLKAAGNPKIHRIDGGTHPKERVGVIQRFSPISSNRPDLAGADNEIDILISTDVLSEGQNLQDCAHLVNYDLHWNPMRMVQRAGRIDRIGTKFDTLYIHNMFPDEGLEKLLGIVARLMERIRHIDRQGLMDASLFGEVVHPRDFNALKRIQNEDATIIDEEERFGELASSEFLLRQLNELLATKGTEWLQQLPDGIHSGLVRRNAKGLFFYFQAPDPAGRGKQHFWRYYDLIRNDIVDNRYRVAQLIACQPDTSRVTADYDAFTIQELVVAHILAAYREQEALKVAPARLDPLQTTVATALQTLLSSPQVKRDDVIAAIGFVSGPMLGVQIRDLRRLHRAYLRAMDAKSFVDGILEMIQRYGRKDPAEAAKPALALRKGDLHLICFMHICS